MNSAEKGYSNTELNLALDLAHFLYELWIKSRKNEIIKLDKTFYDNEESNKIN
ncbi:hypothetical protein IJ098_02580 [Candidatus Saccharibacteria bacterium]|nr:hypothetical protein [Candidatus Saccharibacteria bacterium]